ncbi:MAG: FAD-dependent oxidoreductase [Anaerolineae bacterium]
MTKTDIQLYGAHWCPDCRRSKRFLGEQQIAYDWIDIEKDEEARHYVEQVNNGKRIIPTIVFPDGSILVEPSNAELAQKLGLRTTAEREFYDLIVVGAGPAGLTTALYTAREGIDTLVVEMGGLGGQAAATQDIENIPGFPEGVTGTDFADRLVRQAQRYGVEILQAQEVTRIEARDGNSRWVITSDGSEYGARALLIATGADYRRLNVPGEEDYIGAGVHFCATCDGPFYKGEELVVVGGGNSAAEEGVFLTRFSPKVTLLVRGGELTASQVAVDKVMDHPAIDVLFHTEVNEFHGKGGKLKRLTVENRQTGEQWEMTPGGVFVFIGQLPNSDFVRGTLATNQWGYILTGHDLEHAEAVGDHTPAFLETSIPGVFAAGDVRSGSTKQVASAAGEGATAALLIREHLKET